METRNSRDVRRPIEVVHDASDVGDDSAPEGEKATLGQAIYARIKEEIFEFTMAPGQRYS